MSSDIHITRGMIDAGAAAFLEEANGGFAGGYREMCARIYLAMRDVEIGYSAADMQDVDRESAN